ncbi:MAG: hypothetical protein AMXMBFR85_04880, partial [Dehalococcoides mccartyi]
THFQTYSKGSAVSLITRLRFWSSGAVIWLIKLCQAGIKHSTSMANT